MVDNKVWEDKDRRIVRQSSIKSAIEYMSTKEKESTISEVLQIARKIESWVYRDE